MDHMQPLQDFVDHFVKAEWKQTAEYVFHDSALHRFRVIVEHAKPTNINDSFIDVWRSDMLMKEGVNAACDDAKELAQQIADKMFYHLSPHQTMHIIAALQKQIDEWHAERCAVFAANPKIFGNTVPQESDKYCNC